MTPRPFKYSDVNSINKWLEYQGHPVQTYWTLPKLGFIIPGVCAGFIRHVEGGYGILDGLVSNPLVSAKTRHKALDTLFTQLLSVGPDKLMGTTIDAGTLKRAKRHGFIEQPYTVLTKSKG